MRPSIFTVTFRGALYRQYFAPPHLFAGMPDRRGIVLQNFNGRQILMDFAAIKIRNVSCLAKGLFEEVYVDESFSAVPGLMFTLWRLLGDLIYRPYINRYHPRIMINALHGNCAKWRRIGVALNYGVSGKFWRLWLK
jgi:hypothetical protein